MDFEQLVRLLKFVCENNGWNPDTFSTNACEKHRICYKYVDFTLDTRDTKIFHITFRDGSGPIHEKKFRVEYECDLKEVYDFLNDDFASYRKKGND